MLTQRQEQKQHRRVPWGRITIAIFFSLLFAGAATIGILNNLNSLFNILSLIFAILAALFALFQWLFPFSSTSTSEASPVPIPSPVPPITIYVSSDASQKQETNKDTPRSRVEQQTSLWTVPYQRNPFFTGREALLTYLHDQLNRNKATALTQTQAISGLGGIGKTQTAVEYTYRYRDEYRFVFWIRAATRDTLIADFVTLADLLQLQKKDEQDQALAVAAVKRWLAGYQEWLLILDNADKLDLINDFLPAGNNGHTLITTRAQAVGLIAHSIAVEKMDIEEATLFLLRRTRVLAAKSSLSQIRSEDRTQAQAIVAEMDGLPLALDQAGAYIEETGCSLSRYLDLYHTHRRDFLQRRSQFPTDHPESVATTWSLSFQKIAQANRASVDLLRLCAFLDPDAIPEELFIEGAPDLGPVLMPQAADPLKMEKVIEEVLRYSLIKRSMDAKTLSIHRLVQAVLKDGMNQKIQRQWAERAVRAVNRTFPEVKVTTWSHCQYLLPQAQICTALVSRYKFDFPEAAQLLFKTGSYLEAFAQYEHAEPLYQLALSICEQVLEHNHPDTASILHSLGQLYWKQAKYAEAEPLYLRALAIREQTLGPTHLDTASSLHYLGLLYAGNRTDEAEELYLRALAIYKQMPGPIHPDTAFNLHNLGQIYRKHSRYKEAESLYLRALEIHEQMLGPTHPDTAWDLQFLGQLYSSKGRYKEAEPLYLRALAIREQTLGPTHPDTASILHSLGQLYWSQGRYKEAEPLFLRELAIYEQVLGSNPFDIASSHRNLGLLYSDQGRFKEAESHYLRALSIYEQVPRSVSPGMGRLLEEYAYLLLRKGRIIKATQAGIGGLKILGLRETVRYGVLAVRIYARRRGVRLYET